MLKRAVCSTADGCGRLRGLNKTMAGANKRQKTILEALKEAVERERSAKEFYRKRVQDATDPEVRGIYDQLYQEEVDHEMQLTAKFKDLCKKWGLNWEKELSD